MCCTVRIGSSSCPIILASSDRAKVSCTWELFRRFGALNVSTSGVLSFRPPERPLTAAVLKVRRMSPTCKNTLAHFGVDYISTLIIHISPTMSGYNGPYNLLSRHWELLDGRKEGTNQNSFVHTAARKNYNTDVCSATPDNDYEQEDTTQRLSCKSCYRQKTKCSLVNTTEPGCVRHVHSVDGPVSHENPKCAPARSHPVGHVEKERANVYGPIKRPPAQNAPILAKTASSSSQNQLCPVMKEVSLVMW